MRLGFTDIGHMERLNEMVVDGVRVRKYTAIAGSWRTKLRRVYVWTTPAHCTGYYSTPAEAVKTYCEYQRRKAEEKRHGEEA